MKTILILLCLAAQLVEVSAQGTFNFVVNLMPPNSSQVFSSGTLVLSGNSLSYSFGATGPQWYPTDATINGPASTGATAPVLFHLDAPVGFAPYVQPPSPAYPGGYLFEGSVNNLTSAPTKDLLAGLWYVNAFSTDYPAGGEIRGQITPVPEPSTLGLLSLGLGILALRARRRSAHSVS